MRVPVEASATPPAPGVTTRVMGGSLWAIAGQGLTMVATLLATPFTLRQLGPELYGLLTLISLLIGYAAFADLGMGVASTKFAAEAHAEGDARGESAAVWTSLAVTLVASLVVALGLVAGARPILDRFFKLPDQLVGVTVLALQLAAAGLVARAVASVLNTPQLVRLRMGVNVTLNTITGLLQILLVPLVLLLGGGLLGAVVVTVATALLNMLLNGVVSAAMLPQLWRPAFQSALLGPMVKFGLGMIATSVVSLTLINFEKLILTRHATSAALAYYAVANTVANLVTYVPGALTGSLLPAFARFRQQGDLEALKLLYVRILRVMLVWTLPVLVVVVVVARPFLAAWAGPEYGRQSTGPLYILLVGVLFQILSRAPKEVIKTYGRTDLFPRYLILELGPFVLAAIPLTIHYGAVGAAIAWSLRYVGDALLLFRGARLLSGLRFAPFPRWGPALQAFALLLPPVALVPFARGGTGLAVLSAVTLASLLAYAWVAWRRVLAEDERRWLLRMLSGLRRAQPAAGG